MEFALVPQLYKIPAPEKELFTFPQLLSLPEMEVGRVPSTQFRMQSMRLIMETL
jgi:hypothetical protein